MYHIMNLLVISFVLAGSSWSLLGYQDDFSSKRSGALASNPTYNLPQDKGYGRDMYQPYYICEPDNDGSALTLPSWHYSCKESCMGNHLKIVVNITGARWNYVGISIPVFKIVTNEVCYTSHENVWGYCSQYQISRPVATQKSDVSCITSSMWDNDKSPIGSLYNIVNSNEAECDYFSDITDCNRDYQIFKREGKLIKRSDDSPLELSIVTDGIRTDPASEYLSLDDVSWFWKLPNNDMSPPCGWEKTQKLSCSYTDTTDVIKCNSIGYTYNIQGISKKSTCAGNIYDTDGPFPFFYDAEEALMSTDDACGKAKQGKPDADIAFIEGVNRAFEDLELTYCSATCDLFARQGTPNEDHVLDTPIGTWRYVMRDNLDPALVPCLPTSNWTISDPTTICHGKDHILVVDTATGHSGSWDTKKDYIITGEVCNTNNDEMGDDYDGMRDKILRGETIEIKFWTGDIIRMAPPYDNPEWINGSVLFRQNPSWFSSVELNKDMIHTRDNITDLLTVMVQNATAEVMYKRLDPKTMKHILFAEIVDGVGNVSGKISRFLTGLFGGFTKAVIIVASLAICYIVLSVLWKVRLVASLFNSAKKKRVRISDILDEEPHRIQQSRPTLSRKKKTRESIQMLLNDI
nr:glycoprotein [Sonchus yellow net nucleorhabdovirus]